MRYSVGPLSGDSVTVTKIGFGVSTGVEMLLEDKLEIVGVAVDVAEGTDGLGVDVLLTDDVDGDVGVGVGIDEAGVGVDDDDDFKTLLELQLDDDAGAG
ncbi:uncharacterized protein J4E92_005889 [Alternaria infectoria]|uniref:uncharacterized protein n=1 Tax=Alternaria metachromatica TaxID=283354 RepID=UPI0020C57179|nr:uncharacterized protein J4E83_002223 [Alternaria metachromatica]XP_049248697.1 uncharacterized protein J4E84_000541 [Alternaria hordeiaustralica]XP_051352925.1 uncharacterized protein J4E92_005889 [Alternaria infectoria]KAI4633126.1 hypothetical protein J4E80_000489 [Alternaria sp. BMP 0032]KAI4711992.1 hypothetical protein J4E89_003438 [Alternaria sp. Ai002NY15]KAI4634901.1 hypothetical protein J4E83_002223 [Alternaria metachromatica]KAI4697411.1 hypothetical protein J4E84_000541 [Alterna